MWQNSYDGSPTLYIIPTPIGNLEDITIRAINILKEVEVVFSEDTRVTSLLLKHYDIKKHLISLHDHNEDKVKENVLEYLIKGNDVAIVTDRGTPIISDPGYKTVEYVVEKGFNVISLPGATAFVPALTSSGINPKPFTFYGFLNSKESKCKKELEELKFLKSTIIFYEAPHRLEKTLKLIFSIFGERKISISREISKKYESVFRGNLSELLNNLGTIKGEYVLVVEGYNDTRENVNDLTIIDNVNLYVNNGMKLMDAIKIVAKERNIPKSEVYKEYHLNLRR